MKPSPSLDQVVASTCRCVLVVGFFVPPDDGLVDGIESALNWLNRGCLQYFNRPGPLNATANIETLTSYLPVLTPMGSQSDGLHRFREQFQHAVYQTVI